TPPAHYIADPQPLRPHPDLLSSPPHDEHVLHQFDHLLREHNLLHIEHHLHNGAAADHVIDHHDHNHTNHDLHYSTAHDEHVLDEFDHLLHEHNNLHIEHDLHDGATLQLPHHVGDLRLWQRTVHKSHIRGDRWEMRRF